jgi:hypothetical protein
VTSVETGWLTGHGGPKASSVLVLLKRKEPRLEQCTFPWTFSFPKSQEHGRSLYVGERLGTARHGPRWKRWTTRALIRSVSPAKGTAGHIPAVAVTPCAPGRRYQLLFDFAYCLELLAFFGITIWSVLNLDYIQG